MDNTSSVAAPLPSAKTSGLAVASLILAVCGLFTCGLTAFIGLILGIVAVCTISKKAGQLKGRGLAIAGIATSAIVIVLVPFIAIIMAILMPAFAHARTQAKTVVSLNQAKHICLAMIMYSEQNDGRLPQVDNWPVTLAPYLGDKNILESSAAPHAGRAWAMNAYLDGRRVRDIKQPARTVLIFQARPGSPPAGGPELIDRPQGQKGYIIGFLDSHVEVVPPVNLTNLIWMPDAQKQPYDIIR